MIVFAPYLLFCVVGTTSCAWKTMDETTFSDFGDCVAESSRVAEQHNRSDRAIRIQVATCRPVTY